VGIQFYRLLNSFAKNPSQYSLSRGALFRTILLSSPTRTHRSVGRRLLERSHVLYTLWQQAPAAVMSVSRCVKLVCSAYLQLCNFNFKWGVGGYILSMLRYRGVVSTPTPSVSV
jgi:hypothetical protein